MSTYASATGDTLRAGAFLHETSKWELRFPSLATLMAGVLSIPPSNADSEEGFSMLRKIHTDQHPTLKQSTIIAPMAIKFNSDECCHDTTFISELLTKCKRATLVSLNRKQST